MSKIYSVNGPIIKSLERKEFKMSEMVYVGHQRLLGEVISIEENFAIIQVYESSTGLQVGEPIEHTGKPLSVELGPGLLGNIFDGIGRPLIDMKHTYGGFLDIGQSMPTLNRDNRFTLEFKVADQSSVNKHDLIAVIQETGAIEHRFFAPESGIINILNDGKINVTDLIYSINKRSYTAFEVWPIRHERPIQERLNANVPLITGQRVIDTMFPIPKGGSAAIPGGFGAGKTMLQHQLAKYCDADIIVYIGCGERGNEMAQVLQEFSELVDPKTGHSLLDRTILIANTSNMPVAAREASIYTGITFAEYYRDMGYHVALMADSTSRWAEALRELSGRLEEMPAEEGFPAYLASRLSQFYERSSYVKTLHGDLGSISIVGAISPQGADFSEPVTQNTQRFIGSFWALDKNLAYIRHFPSINYNDSYSEYVAQLTPWFDEHISSDFMVLRQRLLSILEEETSLLEIVKLIGSDVLADKQQLTLEIGRCIRVGYLQQNAFHDYDANVSLEKQLEMMRVIMHAYDASLLTIEKHIPLSSIRKTRIFEDIISIKYDVDEDLDAMKQYYSKIDAALASIE